MAETACQGTLAGLDDAVNMAEHAALKNGGFAEAQAGGVSVAAVNVGPLELPSRAHGVIAVARQGRPFSDDDRVVLRSLGVEAALALENIELHFQVRRQAVRRSTTPTDISRATSC